VHGQKYERNLRAERAQRLQGTKAAPAWHRDIRDDDVDFQALSGLYERFAVFDYLDDIEQLGEKARDAFGDDVVIVGNEDATIVRFRNGGCLRLTSSEARRAEWERIGDLGPNPHAQIRVPPRTR